MIALEFGLVQLIEDGRRIVGIPDRVMYFWEVASKRQFANVAMEDLGIVAWRRLNCEVAKTEPCDTSAIC